MTTTFQESLVKARKGNPAIDTPHAAADLYYILTERFSKDHGVIEIRRVDHGCIEFRVKSTIFRFSYKPGTKFTAFCRNMESDKWVNTKFDNEASDPSEHLISLVVKYAYDEPPNPIGV